MKIKYIIPIIAVGLFVIIIMVLNKPKDTPKETGQPKANQTAVQSVGECGLPEKVNFQSLDKLEVGQGDAAEALDYWSLSVDKNTITWNHSNKVETGIYVCDGRAIKADIQGATKMGLYNTATNLLVFDGHNYKALQN